MLVILPTTAYPPGETIEPFTPSGKAVAMASPMNRPIAAPSTKTGKNTPDGMGSETATAVNKNCVMMTRLLAIFEYVLSAFLKLI